MTVALHMRRYVYRLYPSAGQDSGLHAQRRLHGALWNAIHEISETQYRRTGKRPSAYDLGKQIRDLRRECPEFRAIGSTALGLTIKRYDAAWKAYFRRFKGWRNGGSDRPPAPPSYRATERYPGFDLAYKSNGTPGHWGGSGWRFDFGAADQRGGLRHGRFYIMGINGLIRARGRMPAGFERIMSGTVRWTGQHWELSLAVEMKPRRKAGAAHLTVEVNLIDEFARVTASDGRCAPGPEADLASGDGQIRPQTQEHSRTAGSAAPASGSKRRAAGSWNVARAGSAAPASGSKRRNCILSLLRDVGSAAPSAGSEGRERKKLSRPVQADELQQRLSRCRRGSCTWRDRKRRLAVASLRDSRRRQHALHELTTALVRHGSEITLIRPPPIKELTASAAGTAERPGVMVAAKAQANRAILSQAPATFIAMLEYKAAEAGASLTVVEAGDLPAVVPSRLVEAAKSVRRAKRVTKRRQKNGETDDGHRDPDARPRRDQDVHAD